MNPGKLAVKAFKNTFRSRMRTFLTALAIFIGAFTLVLTNGIGTGINQYIDTQLGSIGGDNVMDVRKGSAEEMQAAMDGGIQEYDPEAQTSQLGGGFNIEVLSDEDIETIETVEGVESVRPVYMVAAEYITTGDTKYQVSINFSLPGNDLDFMAGGPISDETKNQLILTDEYAEILGFDNPQDAVGETVVIGAKTVAGEIETIEAEVTGVQKPTLIDLGINTSESVREALYEISRTGMPEGSPDSYIQAQVTFAQDASDEQIQALKDRLDEAGYYGVTVQDQIGMFKTIIDVIVGVLNGFAVIALIAAAFGIVNTLLMSVQERTREIGLMKAMGLGSGKIFALFSFEAMVIGLMGSLAGIAVGMGVGLLVNNLLRGSLEALGGIDVIVFDPLTLAIIVAIVLFIAFLAGTLPASRAAKQNPIDALRYE